MSPGFPAAPARRSKTKLGVCQEQSHDEFFLSGTRILRVTFRKVPQPKSNQHFPAPAHNRNRSSSPTRSVCGRGASLPTPPGRPTPSGCSPSETIEAAHRPEKTRDEAPDWRTGSRGSRGAIRCFDRENEGVERGLGLSHRFADTKKTSKDPVGQTSVFGSAN